MNKNIADAETALFAAKGALSALRALMTRRNVDAYVAAGGCANCRRVGRAAGPAACGRSRGTDLASAGSDPINRTPARIRSRRIT